jgi:hypothetical protein
MLAQPRNNDATINKKIWGGRKNMKNFNLWLPIVKFSALICGTGV